MKWSLPVFYYKPQLLEEAVEKIETKHNMIGNAPLVDEKERIRYILNKVQGLDIQHLQTFAYELKTRDLYIICSIIGNIDYAKGLQNKLLQILRWRYRRAFLKYFWDAVQQNPSNMHILSFFRELFENSDNPTKFLSISLDNHEAFKTWINSDLLCTNAAVTIINQNTSFWSFLERFSIRGETSLADQILIDLLSKGGRSVFSSFGYKLLNGCLNRWSIEVQAKVLNNYILKHQISELWNEVMVFIEHKYIKPDEPRQAFFWDQLQPEVKRKYSQWYFEKTLEIFFSDQERLFYWKKWIPKLDDLHYTKKYQQLFMNFGAVVVIEFGQSGNAAYFYPAPYFKEHLGKYASNQNCKPNSSLKINFGDNTIAHRGYWQWNMSEKLREYGIL